MESREKKARTIDFNKAKIVSTYNDLSKHIVDSNDIVSRLTRRLQTSLEVETIISMFVEEVRGLVTFDQFEHENPHAAGIIIGNKRGVHSCLYNISLDDIDLGSIRFSRGKRFMEEELAIIERLTGTLVFPLRNAVLYEQALKTALMDPLTGFGNKRALDAGLHREADRAVRHGTQLSVIMLDVDHFKKINDTHGHSAGDKVLSDLAQCIKMSARQSDLCYRFGGEEFLIVLDKTDANQAFQIAERLRLSVENAHFSYEETEIPTTISLGTATFEPGETLESLKNRADEALYRAKSSGRNKVVCGREAVAMKSEIAG